MPWCMPSPSDAPARRGGTAIATATVAVIAVVAVLLAAAWLWRSVPQGPGGGIVSGRTASASTPALPPEFAQAPALLAFTAQAQGGLEPCGCVAGMHGGLARRASLLARVPAASTLVLDGPGWNAGAADYQVVKSRFYLDASRIAGVDALALGAADLRLGAAVLTRVLAQPQRPPVVCANLDPAAAAAVGAVASLRVSWMGRDTVVTALAAAGGEGLPVGDVAVALLRVIDAAGTAPVVAVTELDAEAAEALARQVPGAAVLIAAGSRDPVEVPRQVGSTRIVGASNHGKVLGWYRPEAVAGTPAALYELIRDTIPDDAEVRATIRSYQEALGAMDLAIDERLGGGLTRLGGGEQASFAGTDSCLACHADAHRIHAASRHAHALATLEKKGYARDPECLKCHVTGLGQAGGWPRRGGGPEWAAAVSCESCHGRGSGHVAAKQGRADTAGGAPLTAVTPATCTACHDGDNSPHFDYVGYWPKIAH